MHRNRTDQSKFKVCIYYFLEHFSGELIFSRPNQILAESLLFSCVVFVRLFFHLSAMMRGCFFMFMRYIFFVILNMVTAVIFLSTITVIQND